MPSKHLKDDFNFVPVRLKTMTQRPNEYDILVGLGAHAEVVPDQSSAARTRLTRALPTGRNGDFSGDDDEVPLPVCGVGHFDKAAASAEFLRQVLFLFLWANNNRPLIVGGKTEIERNEWTREEMRALFVCLKKALPCEPPSEKPLIPAYRFKSMDRMREYSVPPSRNSRLTSTRNSVQRSRFIPWLRVRPRVVLSVPSRG